MAQNKLSFSVTSDDPLKELLARATPDRAESALRQAAVAGARVYFDEIQTRARSVARPTLQKGRTKHLWETLLIAYKPEDSVTGKRATYMVTFSADGWYVRFLEFGRSKMPAQPIIRPSYEAKQDEASQVTLAKLKGALIGE